MLRYLLILFYFYMRLADVLTQKYVSFIFKTERIVKLHIAIYDLPNTSFLRAEREKGGSEKSLSQSLHVMSIFYAYI